MTKEKTEVTKVPAGINTPRDLLHSPKFIEIINTQAGSLMSESDVLRMMGAVWTTFQKEPKLMNCTLDSIAHSLKEAALVGLFPDGLQGEAYLIPYKQTCTLIMGKQGMKKIVEMSDNVDIVTSDLVYKDDDFEMEKGTKPFIKHTPNVKSPNRKPVDIIGCYCVGYLSNGREVIEYMTRDEIKQVQNGSPGSNSTPWKDHWGEMARKTVFRRIFKSLPLTRKAIELVDRDMEREEPKRVFDADDEDVHTPAKSIEALTSDLKGEGDTEGTLVCSECGIEGDIGPGGNCSPCQARLDNEQ